MRVSVGGNGLDNFERRINHMILDGTLIMGTHGSPLRIASEVNSAPRIEISTVDFVAVGQVRNPRC